MALTQYVKESDTFHVGGLMDAEEPCLRTFADFMELNRSIQRLQRNGDLTRDAAFPCEFPYQRLKKLTSESWVVAAEGWKAMYSKSLRVIEEWLRMVQTLSYTHGGGSQFFFDEKLYRAHHQERSDRRIREFNAKNYQQFFSSVENINTIKQLILQPSALGATEGCEKNDLAMLYHVEPSCGDGRVLKALLDQGTKCIGVELDANAYNLALAHIADRCPIIHSDFLKVTRRQLINKIQEDEGRQIKDDDIRFQVTGCPPYSFPGNHSLAIKTSQSSSSSSSSSTLSSIQTDIHMGADKQPDTRDAQIDKQESHVGRDIIMEFLKHAAHELRAERIVFTNPKRCDNPTFRRSALEMLNGDGDGGEHSVGYDPKCGKENASGDVDLQESVDDLIGDGASSEEAKEHNRWELTYSESANEYFDLVGRLIKQPSVIQVWEKVAI